MKTQDQFHKELDQLAKVVEVTSIWRPASVLDEPETTLIQWRVYAVTDDNLTTVHFVGYARYEGRVSSSVQTYDPTTKRGITKSGRVYELLGVSGYNRDAAYVFNAWCARFPKEASFVDVTKQYE